jgi:hypothetical protein
MNRRKFMAAGLAAPSLALSGCGILTKSYTYRFRIKLYSIINGVARVDSTVIEGRWVDTLVAGSFDSRFWGDAIFVGLAPNRAIIALLGSVPGQPDKFNGHGGWLNISSGLFRVMSGENVVEGETLAAVPRILDRERDVPPLCWPRLIYFPELNNIQSGHYLDVDGFGAGFSGTSKLSRVTISLTDDAITQDIDQKLPWFDQVGKFNKFALVTASELPRYQQLQPRNFRAEGREL